ncbi:MAG: hypothetical protein JXN64_11045 [Spirochaetes bacterium]|nr:hypothetical protein [Spirochaetota bacterium]
MKKLYAIQIIIVMIFAGCASSSVYVDISHSRYTPRFQSDQYSAYKDKSLFLSSFGNNANNTSVFYYYSPDSKIKYGEYAIVSYYWYCFYKAFNSIGMTVYKDSAPSDIPEFYFEFDHLSDQKINFQATVTKRMRIVYQKTFEITMPAPESVDRPYLEQRAYQMVDNIITAILNDQNFKAAL